MANRWLSLFFSLLLTLICGAPLWSQQTNQATTGSKDPWARFQFLIGDWVGEGTGKPGEGTGGFTVKPELDGHVLVRRNFADYPATANRPATHHQDVMYIYWSDDRPYAMYFDNEGHVIRYEINADVLGTLTFTSVLEGRRVGPTYRLTYHQTAEGAVDLDFAIAPPGPKQDFAMYVQAKARRK